MKNSTQEVEDLLDVYISLNDRRMDVNRRLEAILIPQTEQLLKSNNVDAVEHLLWIMPECVCRMKIAAQLTAYQFDKDHHNIK